MSIYDFSTDYFRWSQYTIQTPSSPPHSAVTREMLQTPPPPQQKDEEEKHPLFEKPLTPSDVGKLNRLVIPKQHAEKWFPSPGGGHGGAIAGDRGLLLSFEDETGLMWRFRYSYWNSSQSYVLTKGWSRYVKEKKLDACDIVCFLRHRENFGRLFIGWKRGGGTSSRSTVTAAAVGHPYLGISSCSYRSDCRNAENKKEVNTRMVMLFGVNLAWEAGSGSHSSKPDGSGSECRTKDRANIILTW